jgi:hypothetical protein
MVFKKIWLLPVLGFLLLAACQPAAAIQAGTPPVRAASSVTPKSSPSLQATELPSALPLQTNEEPKGYDPLTGLIVSNPAKLNRRPVLVKVSNYPRYGRPHAGLSFADIVFEYYIGEEENRFLALYYGQDAPKVGPVRSGRLVDGPLTNMFGGILGYGNADPQVDKVLVKDLGNRALAFKDLTCPAMCGLDTHSIAGVFANTSALSKFASDYDVNNSRQDLSGMLFDTASPIGGHTGTRIGVEYGLEDRGEWRYNSKTGMYQRWIESAAGTENHIPMQALTDRLTGKQLSFANVIILFTVYKEYAPTLFDTMITENTHGQRAVYFRDGKMIDGFWRTAYDNRPIQFLDANKSPMALKPGNTWIVLTGNSSTLDNPSKGNWEMRYLDP